MTLLHPRRVLAGAALAALAAVSLLAQAPAVQGTPDLTDAAVKRAVEQLQHVVNHSTYHRGQVVTLLRQLGVEPIGSDLIAFYRGRDRR
jgi:uncharacterized damage-inducible protein DinB